MELMLNNLMSLKNHLSKLVNCLLFTGLMVVSKKSSNKTWTKKTIAATLSVYMVAGMMTGLPGIGINSAYAAVNTNWVDITGTACLSSPFGITVDSAGNRYIADFANGCIKIQSASDSSWTSVTVPGSNPRPFGIAVRTSGATTTVYTTDANNSEIWEYSVGAEQPWTDITDSANFQGLGGIAVDSVGNLYVADQDGCKIWKSSATLHVQSIIRRYYN